MHLLPLAGRVLAWLIPLAWIIRVFEAHRGLPTLANLVLPEHDLSPAGAPSVTVIVPARNEAADIRACLQSLLDQDYAHVQVIAVDDRSTDTTGATMDALAGPRLRVLHIAELPSGWLGKTHAMAVAAGQASTDFLLFTDADIVFRRDALRRALASAVGTGADHLVLGPTTLIHRWDEAALLAFFQIFGLWAARPWRVADPQSPDAIGIGAFNLIRREAYLQVGGFEALRMEIVEDLGLARRVKAAGLAQRFAYGRGLVNVHWASGVPGLVGVMTKNVFAAFNYHPALLGAACLWLALFCVLPFAAWGDLKLWMPALLTLTAMAYGYRLLSRLTGLSTWNFVLAPFAGLLFIFVLLRSMLVTLRQSGVEWRGTFYSLDELRANAAPLPRLRRPPKNLSRN